MPLLGLSIQVIIVCHKDYRGDAQETDAMIGDENIAWIKTPMDYALALHLCDGFEHNVPIRVLDATAYCCLCQYPDNFSAAYDMPQHWESHVL